MAEPAENWDEEFKLTVAMTRPDRLVAALEAVLKARGIEPGLAVKGTELEVSRGVLLELGDHVHTIQIAAGGARGELSIYLLDGNPELVFAAADTRGEWEPLYFLFVELGRALGGRIEALEAGEGDQELAEVIAAELEEYAPDRVKLRKLEPLATPGEGVRVERTSNDLVITVGARRFQSDGGAGLSDDELAEIEARVAEETAPLLAAASRDALARTAPAADASRAGRWFLDVYDEGGRELRAEQVTAETYEAAVAKMRDGEVAVVTRYFSDGRPFFRAPIDPAKPPGFDSLHLYRTWGWLAPQGT